MAAGRLGDGRGLAGARSSSYQAHVISLFAVEGLVWRREHAMRRKIQNSRLAPTGFLICHQSRFVTLTQIKTHISHPLNA